MQPFTIVIPYRNGQASLPFLLDSLPPEVPVVVVDDQSDAPLQLNSKTARVIRLDSRGYFSGAVNAGTQACAGDVLVLNQDVTLDGAAWLDFVAEAQAAVHGIAGHGQMKHPAWPAGYVQGQFMYLSRKAIDAVGPFNQRDYPLWGATAEWQLRACRRGFTAHPVAEISGLSHARPRGELYGAAIAETVASQPAKRDLFVRTPPMVSVIVTSQAYGRYLPDAVHSLIGGQTCLGEMPGQSFQSFEVIIVDDGSTDETAEIGQGLASDWQAIRYIRRDVRGGTPAANNTGIRAAYGRFITILCGDDLRETGAIEALYRVVERNPKLVPYDDMRYFAKGAFTKLWDAPDYSFEMLLRKNFMHAGIMFARQAWEKVGGYPEVMSEGREDWAFSVALGQAGYCGEHVARPGYLYRREGQNRSLTNQGQDWFEHFQGQMRGLFPRLYAGVRPMGCCGGANDVSVSGGGSGAGPDLESLVGADGMVLLEYLGGNAGSETWYGNVTQQRYVFGGSRKRGWVDRRDAQWFLDVRQNKHQVFDLASLPPEPKMNRAPEPSLEQKLAGAFEPAVAGGTVETMDSTAAPAAETGADGEQAAGETGPIGPEGGAGLSYPIDDGHAQLVEGDPRELTLRGVQAVIPLANAEQLARMLAMENASGSPRKGALAAIQAAIDAPAA